MSAVGVERIKAFRLTLRSSFCMYFAIYFYCVMSSHVEGRGQLEASRKVAEGAKEGGGKEGSLSGMLPSLGRTECGIIAGVILAIPVVSAFIKATQSAPSLPGGVGLALPIVLNALGTSLGTAMIGRSVAGISVKTTGMAMKALVGIIICEANVIFALLGSITLSGIMDKLGNLKEDYILRHNSWCIFCSGMVNGICGMSSSIGTAVVNTSSSVTLAGSPRMFSKLLVLQLIVSSVGPLGLILSVVLTARTCIGLTPDK